MKKVLFVVLAIAGSFFATNNVEAQQKIGVFDIDIMVQAMPGYRAVDSLVAIYEQDSLRGEYEFNMREYTRLDSTYKADSAAKKPPSVLSYIQTDRNKFGYKLVYWQQYSQQMSEGKRQELAGPMYERVVNAYSKVLQTNNYLVVLKPNSYEMGSKVENVFEKVAKELKVPLPEQLRSQGPVEDQQPAKPATGTRPPAPKK
ncbi:MAG: OmpH family outer membrane protein [Segetibacter sp.]|nr:OmpH family outer membrane protein [Segetibacter sp.]